MTTGWLIFLLGCLAGGLSGMVAGRVWGYRNGHLDGYQDHRAEAIELRNAADVRKTPGSELEIRAKTAYGGDLARRITARGQYPYGGALPGGGRPFPKASPRTHTIADDIGTVFVPATDTTVIPLRPQAGRDSGDGTEAMPRAAPTGPMRAITPQQAEDIIKRIRAGTWP